MHFLLYIYDNRTVFTSIVKIIFHEMEVFQEELNFSAYLFEPYKCVSTFE